MKNLCLHLQVHQPFRLRPYHFFDIGSHHPYFDEPANARILKEQALNSYLPVNKLLAELIRSCKGLFKLSISLSGTVLDQLEDHAPEVLQSFCELGKTGCVEWVAETSDHSLASIKSEREFVRQVSVHSDRIHQVFGCFPNVFRNTELIYNDRIGSLLSQLGFEAILTEGAPSVLGWKSPNFLYCSAADPRLKLLLRNNALSDDIGFRFSNSSWSEYPLNPGKFVSWLKAIPDNEEIVNVSLDYGIFGRHPEDSNLFNFLKSLPGEIISSDLAFITPSEAIENLQPVAPLHVPHVISSAGQDHSLSAWLGNDMQNDAFESLYRLEEKASRCDHPYLQQAWKYLQASDHFYYMSTKNPSDGEMHHYFSPYNSPYEAFVNYMNVLSDFENRLNGFLQKQAEAKSITRTEKALAVIRPHSTHGKRKTFMAQPD